MNKPTLNILGRKQNIVGAVVVEEGTDKLVTYWNKGHFANETDCEVADLTQEIGRAHV